MASRKEKEKRGKGKSDAKAKGKTSARYLRGDRGGILLNRRAVTRDGKVDVRESAARASALAYDFLQNSGWIAGAADQVIVDTLGTELKLNLRSDLVALGWTEKEQNDWCELVEREWRMWAWNPLECDLRGTATVAEHLDGALRYWLGSGEAFGNLSYFTAAQRRRYRIETGTKLSLIAPHRLKRETSPFGRIEDGILQDENGRPVAYRFQLDIEGVEREVDIPASDRLGLRRVLHVMDRGENPDSVRGITPFAPIAKVIAQYDQLADATLATALIQTIFAATVKSPEPTQSAFDAISAIGDLDDYDGAEQLRDDLLDVWGQRIDALRDGGGFSTSDHGRINHLGPGESFEFHTAGTPGASYLPFAQLLQREMARRIGVTYSSMSMDFTGASYSSVRMEGATIWPIAVRRRERIAAPLAQGTFEGWLDERIASGRIPFKGGYAAFAANRQRVYQAEWQGPAKPTADDYRAAMASKVRLEAGTSNLSRECAEDGQDWQEIARQRARERAFYVDELKLADPFQKMTGGAGPMGAAAEGQREPEKADT